jgi:hypothetical protein
MAIVSAFIALLSFFIACLALMFTIGSFWWLNARQGRLLTFEPHSFAAAATSDRSRLRLPLVFYNTGAKPIIVQNLRLWILGSEPTLLAWIATRSQLMPDPGDLADLQGVFSIPGRTAQQKFMEFGGIPARDMPAHDCQVQIDVKLGHRNQWDPLIIFTLWATRITDPRHYITYPNLPSGADGGPRPQGGP